MDCRVTGSVKYSAPKLFGHVVRKGNFFKEQIGQVKEKLLDDGLYMLIDSAGTSQIGNIIAIPLKGVCDTYGQIAMGRGKDHLG